MGKLFSVVRRGFVRVMIIIKWIINKVRNMFRTTPVQQKSLRDKYARISDPAMITLLGVSFLATLFFLWLGFMSRSWELLVVSIVSAALFAVIMSRRHKVSEEPLEIGIVNVFGRDTNIALLPDEWIFPAPFTKVRNKKVVPEKITVTATDVEIVLREGSVSGSGKVTFITDVLVAPKRDDMKAFVAIGLMEGLKDLLQGRHQAGLLTEVPDKTWKELKSSAYAKVLNENIRKILSAPLDDGRSIGGEILNINMKEMIPNDDIKKMLQEEAQKVAENIEADTMAELAEKIKKMFPELSDQEVLAAIENQQGRRKTTQQQVVFTGSGGQNQGDVTKAASLILAGQGSKDVIN